MINNNLVGGWALPLWKMMESVGMMTFPTEWKVIKFMFQTTNQLLLAFFLFTAMVVYLSLISSSYPPYQMAYNPSYTNHTPYN